MGEDDPSVEVDDDEVPTGAVVVDVTAPAVSPVSAVVVVVEDVVDVTACRVDPPDPPGRAAATVPVGAPRTARLARDAPRIDTRMSNVRRTVMPRRSRAGLESRSAIRVLAALALLLLSLVPSPAVAAPRVQPAEEPPVLAHYYIWFDHSSWRRAKKDLPLVGTYSSDDRAVVRQHVDWAKDAGIDGLIVSWKHTETLDRRLRLLAEEAEAGGLALAVIYQGLDFHRVPLPIARVREDFAFFAEEFAPDPTFRIAGRPTVIWNGTWEFSTAEIASVTEPMRPKLRILASEKNPEDYGRVAPIVDGNSYYWSSGDPISTEGHADKLRTFGEVVHAAGGFWVAPVTAGYDARMLGGDRVVERRDGETLRRGYAAAVASAPDAVGLISWNEFSENSHIEPSEAEGTGPLEDLRDLLGERAPIDEPETLASGPAGAEDDGSGEASSERSWRGIGALAVTAVLLTGGFVWALQRRS